MEDLVKAFQAQVDRTIDNFQHREDRLAAGGKIEGHSVESSSSSRWSCGSGFRTISVDRRILISSSTNRQKLFQSRIFDILQNVESQQLREAWRLVFMM